MSGDPIADLTAEILRRAKDDPRVKAMPEGKRLAWARGQAESDDQMARRKAANRAERNRKRAEHDAAVADLSTRAGISEADAAEAIRRRKKADWVEGIARAETLLAREAAHNDASPVASAHLAAAARRSAGRTAWDDDWSEFDRRLEEAEADARASFASDPEAVAKRFRPLIRPINGQTQRGMQPESLRKLVRRRANAGAISSG